MTRFVAFTRAVFVVFVLFLGMIVASCSKPSSTGPTPLPPPPVTVPAEGPYPVIGDNLPHISFVDGVSADKVPVTISLRKILPVAGTRVYGSLSGTSGCGPASCFQWEIEICGEPGVERFAANVYLSENPGGTGRNYGPVSIGAPDGGGIETSPGCFLFEQIYKARVSQSGHTLYGPIQGFPLGERCCEYLSVVYHLLIVDGKFFLSGKGHATFITGYKGAVN